MQMVLWKKTDSLKHYNIRFWSQLWEQTIPEKHKLSKPSSQFRPKRVWRQNKYNPKKLLGVPTQPVNIGLLSRAYQTSHWYMQCDTLHILSHNIVRLKIVLCKVVNLVSTLLADIHSFEPLRRFDKEKAKLFVDSQNSTDYQVQMLWWISMCS